MTEGEGFEEDRDAYIEDNVFFVLPRCPLGLYQKERQTERHRADHRRGHDCH